MPCLRTLATLVVLTGLTSAHRFLDAITTSASTTDYRTMPPGTYTETKTDGSVLIIIVEDPTQVVADTSSTWSSSLGSMPTCPIECDCSRIEDKDSEDVLRKLGVDSAKSQKPLQYRTPD
ncbi:hypothetical protein B0J13DRAFT_531797 [Dactylonectria estremocensis]|uniref:Uncharacterized protein n=1 Tax=Dactylonectria estremocensis TaxID=1079267 RepID=A0A9P9DMT6_9HYPO|nr:hypothetical protein B0J13DRAFT_531797 [Dactylonectria estremocensis]